METIIFSLGGLFIGGIITYFTSKYFHNKGLRSKELSTYIQFLTEILDDIDPEVEQKLKVYYDEKVVDKLYQMQYVIANTGDLPIRDLIEPLKLSIPNQGKILDVSLIYIEPEGRKVNYKITNDGNNDCVEFFFPLLNASEYFIAKILIKGEPPYQQKENTEKNEVKDYYSEYMLYEKYEFTITVDDLPPKLISEPLPTDYETENTSKPRDYTGIIIIAVGWLLCFFPIYILSELNNIKEELFIFNFSMFFQNFSFLKFSIIIGWLIMLLVIIVSIGLLYSEFGDLKPRKQPKILLPKKLRGKSNNFLKYLR